MADVVPGIVIGTGNKYQGEAGVAIAKGQWVYADTSDANKLKLADSDAATTALISGVALNTAAIGEESTIQTDGVVDLGVVLAAGMLYILSATAGAIIAADDALAFAASTFPSLVGRANTAGDLVLGINNALDAV